MATAAPTKRGRDVSNEPRDERGRWTIAGLDDALKRLAGIPRDDVVERNTWFLPTTGGHQREERRIDFAHPGFLSRMLGLSHTSDPRAEHPPGSDGWIAQLRKRLTAPQRETLDRLSRGDIPAEWGHDKGFLEQLSRWSDGSRLNDKTGLPYRLYHGTATAFNFFDAQMRGTRTGMRDAGFAFFFTASPDDAGYFSFWGLNHDPSHHRADQPAVMPVYVRLKNPLVVADRGALLDMELSKNALVYARQHGYDGVVLYGGALPETIKGKEQVARLIDGTGNHKVPAWKVTDGIIERTPDMVVGVFDANDIKSASGNRGDFGENMRLDRSADERATLLLVKSKATHRKPKAAPAYSHEVGQEIEYRHPNYPNSVRKGVVLSRGPSGYTILHHPSFHEERVRHVDVVVPKSREGQQKDVAKSLGLSTATTKLLSAGLGKGPKKQGLGGGAGALVQAGNAAGAVQGAQVWTPKVIPVPYEVGHDVVYQRPDMAEPRIGRIAQKGAHGAVVSLPTGARHKVRWPDIHGKATAHVLPEERADAAEALGAMGLKMDPLESLLSGDRRPKADSALVEKLKVLAGTGAPVDIERASSSTPDAIKRLVTHLTSLRPH